MGGEEKSKSTLVHLLSVESAIIDQIFACSSIFNFNALSAGLRAEARGRCWITSSISTRPPWPVARCALYGLLPVGSRSRSPCRRRSRCAGQLARWGWRLSKRHRSDCQRCALPRRAVVSIYLGARRCDKQQLPKPFLIRRRLSSGFRPPTERLTHWMTLRAKKARSSSSSATIVRMLKR